MTRPTEGAATRRGVGVEASALERALEESERRRVELERQQDEFVHALVHDLRSPLNALCVFLEMLEADTRDVLSSDSRSDVEGALAAARTLAEMVSSILDVSRAEAGDLVPRSVPCDLVELAHAALGALGALVGDRAVSVVAEPGLMASADPHLVARVLQNLLANSVAFTPARGTIVVTVGADGDFLRISVADTGPGVPPGDQDRLFQKWGRAGQRPEGRRWSTGLGLAFCKLAVEAHGGRIGVAGGEGRGNTFWFTLPRARS